MATIVRVKRRRDEKPADSLVFSRKRARLENGVASKSEEGIKDQEQVFKFAGTVQPEDKVVPHVKSAIKKDKLQREYKRHELGDFKEDNRDIKQSSSKSGRYKIVSEKRAIELDSLDGELETEKKNLDNKYTLLDITTDDKKETEEKLGCNGEEMIRTQSDLEYVYDVYYYNKGDFGDPRIDEILDIRPVFNDVILNQYRCGDDSDDQAYEDDDDSNDEGNYRNDYPDEDPHYIDPENFDDDVEDDDYTKYVQSYYDESEITQAMKEWTIEASPDHSDVSDDDRGGKVSYEDYKSRVMKELGMDS
ncbi:DgyrCDS5784 [Dimorphilus gyrociliatus]|uniref:Probable RNA polymerase II nuclear localization protein SLC7A6OS n=1 Tax=Dimorphilus gyrociliatus TaxID=2664684 RepID=A0A7I8VMH6_9ANNE|nr:DgyrCDS5784 [Dimorphilus gyrociliatus]